MAYALLAHPAAQRDLDGLPRAIADGVRQVLRALAAEPRSSRFDLKVLQGGGAILRRYRLRVGEYRVILAIDHEAKEVLVVRVGHRSTVYRGWAKGD